MVLLLQRKTGFNIGESSENGEEQTDINCILWVELSGPV